MTNSEMQFEKEYKGRPWQEVIIEIAVMQKVMMQDIADIKANQMELQKTKADKTEFTSYETRLSNVEKKIDRLQQIKWKVFGIAGGVGLFIAVLGQIYYFIKDK